MDRKIIIDAYAEVACPHCGKTFELQDAITTQLIERFESEYESMLEQERRVLRETLAGEAERTAGRRFGEQVARLEEQLEASRATQERIKAQAEGEVGS